MVKIKNPYGFRFKRKHVKIKESYRFLDCECHKCGRIIIDKKKHKPFCTGRLPENFDKGFETCRYCRCVVFEDDNFKCKYC